MAENRDASVSNFSIDTCKEREPVSFWQTHEAQTATNLYVVKCHLIQ